MLSQTNAVTPRGRLLSQSEAAEYLGVNERTVRRLVAAGQLPGYRIGTKTVRVRESDLESLLTPIPTASA